MQGIERVSPDSVKHRIEPASLVPGAGSTAATVAGAADVAGGDQPATAASVCPSWLLRAKVEMPPPVSGYVRRDSLVRQVGTLLQRRLTVLQAPAGFGKTTVLADVGRCIREQGHSVAWLTLDADDSPSVFATYLAYAFERSGLDLVAVGDSQEWATNAVARRVGLLARAIERHGTPCLLALDEVERLPRHTVGLIDLLLKRAPPNLHFAAALRSNPGLDLAPHVLDGSAIIVGASAFRFSKHEIAQFFRGDLSRRKLAAVEKRTAGWPVALMVYRNMQVREAGHMRTDAKSLTANFVDVRLLGDLSVEDRTFLLDLAIFDRLEADLVDEVLGSSDARLRIAAMSALDGLLLAGDNNHDARQLHPLIREYCVGRFAVEAPERKRRLHARIARALTRRGELDSAWRHAQSAGDAELIGELIESVGVVGLWARGGTTQVIAADRLLTAELMESRPRLALLRCVALKLASKTSEAAALHETVGRRTAGFTRDRDGVDASALAFDHLFVQVALAGGSSRLRQETTGAILPVDEHRTGDDAASRFNAAVRHALHCGISYERARFDESRRYGKRSQASFGAEARYGDIYLTVCLGMVAMVQGRVRDATDQYRRARQGARRFFASDPLLAATTEAVSLELDVERNRAKAIQQRALPDMDELRNGWLDVYAAAIGVRTELTFERSGSEAAVKFLWQLREDAGATGSGRLAQHLSALLASCLLRAGRGEEAAALWRDDVLPSAAEDLLDLDGQTWRSMEALACARVMLLADQGDVDAAEELIARLQRTASAQGLARTAMRSRALSILVAYGADELDLAVERLAAFLRAARDVDYVRPLVGHRRMSLQLLQRLLASGPDGDLREAAQSMSASLDKRSVVAQPEFTAREQEVLSDVRHGHRNKEIADRLGITEEGVRYHLKKIYRKTGVSRRQDAVRYALDKGVLR